MMARCELIAGFALLAAAIVGLLWYMIKAPGVSYSGPLKPVTGDEVQLVENLSRHVIAIASREHNQFQFAELEASARYIERTFERYGYSVDAHHIATPAGEVRNVEVEVRGAALASEIIVVGAHYDSVVGAVGANDNGSGVAAVLELARLFREAKPARTLRLVAFVNEEPPFFRTNQMGSRAHSQRSKERGENIVAMLSLETIGYYSDKPGSQRYPFPLGFFYPSTGNFIAFVSNLSSRALLHEVIASFRRHADFPSESVAAPAFIPGVDWSDHWSFWKEGYPALMVTDTAPYRYPYYHTAQDTPDKVDYERAARVVTGLQGMLSELLAARVPGAAE